MPTATASEAQNGSQTFYLRVMSRLEEAGVPYLVGGAYALFHFTSIHRCTKDFDVFVRREDIERAAAALEGDGCRTEITYPHWLGKAFCGDDFVDIIFSSGNAVATVDEEWFAHAPEGDVLGRRAKLSPAEEMIWSKAFIMERERFDGADIHHLLLRCGACLDWPRLLRRFGPHWRVLLSHLILFGFIYPSERTRIPEPLMRRCLELLEAEMRRPSEQRVCRGTITSRAQYLVDVQLWGYEDGRLLPPGRMTESDASIWTAAIDEAASRPVGADALGEAGA